MKTRHFIFILMIAVLHGLAACTDSNEVLDRASSSPRFVLGTVQSRVTYPKNDYTHSVFEEGDVLGAFAIDGNNSVVGTSNARYRVVGTGEGNQTLEPELPQDAFPADASYTYIFYYPFKEGTEYDDVTHMVEKDQSNPALYERSDLLWDAAKGSGESDEILTVNIAMNHAMSNIILEVPKAILYETNPSAKMLSVKSLVSGIHLLEESAEKPTGSMETVLTQDITMWRFTSADFEGQSMHVYRAVIPAQTIENGTDMFSIQTSENGFKTYTAAFSEGEIKFEPGKYYRFTVTKTGLRFRGLIEDLTDGGDYYYEY